MRAAMMTIAACASLLAIADADAGAQPAAGAEPIAIYAGMLLANPGEAPRPRQLILIDDGVVRAVVDGPERFSDVMPDEQGIRRIDLSAFFVLPGLIDAHVHLAHAPRAEDFAGAMTGSAADIALTAARHARVTLDAGFTTVVDLGTLGNPGHDRAIYALRAAVHDGRAIGPRILTVGNPIAATGQARVSGYRPEVDALLDTSSICSGAADCRRAVREQVRRGADLISFFNTGSLLSAEQVDRTMTDAEMRAIVDTAHALGRRVIADGHHAAGIAAALRAGADVIDSAHLYDDGTFALLGDDRFIQSHIHGVVAAVGDSPEDLDAGLWGWLPRPLLEGFYRIKTRPFAVMEAYRAGVRNIVYASDAGVYAWGDNAYDLLEFVDRGMSPEDALRTATVNAARMLNMEDTIGMIAPGMKADLIAVDGDPLANIESMLRVRFVMRDGRVFRR